MDLEIAEEGGDSLIRVSGGDEVAVSVRSGDEEVIYLPGDSPDGSYYGGSEAVSDVEDGFVVRHVGGIDAVELLG